jgi:tripartite-type tricarboxylate transporter receptor subunit TctC
MKLPRREFLRLCAGAAALPMMPRMARAQAYPSRQIRLVAPFPPGGAYDLIARPWAERVKSLLGTVAVENIGGGGASIGSAAVARAQPDGYTLLTAGTLTHVNEALIKARPLYDPVNDLDPIAGIAVVVLGIVVHPSVPVRDLKELAAYARTTPDKLQFAHNGLGTSNHLTYEMFRDQANLPNLVQVPYRGAGPVLIDLIGGQVTFSIVGVTSQTLEMHRTGKIRMLALTNPTRLAGAPDIPTAAEQGFPGITNVGTIGLAAPARTPKPIIDQIAQATRTALSDKTYQQRLIESGFEISTDTTPEKFRASLAKDVAFWKPIVDKLGIKVD